MSKKSKFNTKEEIPKVNEFEEKADEEEEIEDNENPNIQKKDNEPLKEKINSQDPFDISDDEDEVQDKISDLNSIPNVFEIPKPVGGFKPPLPPSNDNPLLKKYEPIDWHKAFPISYNICDGTIPLYIQGEQGPNIICLHGAGHSGLSFAPLALMNKNYRIISFDFRGHGYNTQTPHNDFSEKTLINDTIQVLNHIHEKYPDENLILLGHSMGGSIATKACCEILKEESKYKELYKKMQGLIVIDVVEGTAMDALPFMENIVQPALLIIIFLTTKYFPFLFAIINIIGIVRIV